MTSTPRDAALPREIWVLLAASFLIAIGYGIVAPALLITIVSGVVAISAAVMQRRELKASQAGRRDNVTD